MRTLLLCLAISLAIGHETLRASDPILLESKRQWSGKFHDSVKQSRAPRLDFISDRVTFWLVWNSWRGDEPVPEIDFEKKLVLLAMTSGPNSVSLDASLDRTGNVSLQSTSTLVGGPGFGYTMKVVNRDGIQTVQGVPIDGQGYLNVSGIGSLKTGIVAIGGETTGTTLSVRGGTWELDFSRRPYFEKLLKKLDGKTVYVSGVLLQKRGVEISRRSIVYVDSISEIKTAE